MVTKVVMWQDVQTIWQKEYDWLIRNNYPNEILKFITLFECLLAYSKRKFFSSPDSRNDDMARVQQSDHYAFQTGFKTFFKNEPITTDLNKRILGLCCKLIETCPQPLHDDDSDFKYYDEIKKRVALKYPDSLSIFPLHVYNRFNNPPLKMEGEDKAKEALYIEHLALLWGSSWSIAQKPESLYDIQKRMEYFKFYFTVLIHSRNWIYHNNKSGHAEPDKLILKQHIEIMLFMLENWK